MTQHATQPQICPECEGVAHALAETGPRDDRVLKLCEHGATGVVIGVAVKRGGRILSWTIQGPMTEAETQVALAMIVAAHERAGMKIHKITEQ
jgi:hypothetical protein